MIKDINAITPEYMKHRIEEETQQYKQEIERLKEELEYTIPIVEHNKTITKHLKEIERLNNIINNAIKGIEDYYYGDEEYKKYDYTLAYKIYHILKGSDKE